MIATLTEIDYPSTDGLPMAESTQQYDWITFIKGNLEILFRHEPNVFVAGDLFWYPVQGDAKLSTAPDAMVAFGRPKGPRPSYKQFEEAGIAPQVVFEVWSPSNSAEEMTEKLNFYSQFGVEEFYVYDFTEVKLEGWIRRGKTLQRIPKIEQGWTSPLLKVSMRVDEQLEMSGPDGKPFKELVDMADEMAEMAEQLEELRAEKQASAKREKRLLQSKQAVDEQLKDSLEQQQQMEARLKLFERKMREKGLDPDAP